MKKWRYIRIFGSCLVLILGLIHGSAQSLFESTLSEAGGTDHRTSLSLSGFIRASSYLAKTPEDEKLYLQSGYAQTALVISAGAGSWATAKAEIRLRQGNEFHKSITELEIREAFVDVTRGPAGLKIGKLISPWGKATLFNPTGKMTPMDPTVRSPEEDDMYLGVWAVQGRVLLGPYMKLSATWKPLYTSSVLLIDPVPMPDYVRFLEPDHPEVNLEQGSYGIRYDLHTPPLDASLYWFDGYHHWPGIGFDSFILDTVNFGPLALNLRETAYQVRMLGLDLSVPMGSWVLRAEGAWQQPRESHSVNEYVPYPEISYTAEIERSGSHFTVLAGYQGKYVLDFAPPGAEPSLSADPEAFAELFQQGFDFSTASIDQMITLRVNAFNRLYNDQIEELYHTVFMVGKVNLWHDQLELRLPAVVRTTTKEWIIQPAIGWTPWDGIRISAGLNIFSGGENSLYDMVGPVLNSGYLSVKLSF